MTEEKTYPNLPAGPLLEVVGNVPIDLEPFIAVEDAEAGTRVDGGACGADTEPGRLHVVWIPHNGLVELEVADTNNLVQSRLYLTHADATRLSALLLKGR